MSCPTTNEIARPTRKAVNATLWAGRVRGGGRILAAGAANLSRLVVPLPHRHFTKSKLVVAHAGGKVRIAGRVRAIRDTLSFRRERGIRRTSDALTGPPMRT